MTKTRPCVLSIAGFDPSGGAGILADIKTFEANKVLGMGVVAGITFQNDSEFEGVKWIEADEIIRQIEVLTRKFKIEFIKVGMIQNLETLERVIASCQLPVASCKIVWDPILKASAGFQIHKSFEEEKLISIIRNIFFITPNTDEIKILSGKSNEMEGAKELSKYCNVFLKGGHAKSKVYAETSSASSQKSKEDEIILGRDFLFTAEGKMYPFRARMISKYPKHGSGCVLSSAITANLALGNNLHRSCLKGKDYVTKILFSNKTLLGYHKI